MHLKLITRLLPLFAAVMFLLLAASVAMACPNCKEALAANDPAQSGVMKGYFYSILFMLAVPFTTLGGFGLYMYRQVVRARAAREAAQSAGKRP